MVDQVTYIIPIYEMELIFFLTLRFQIATFPVITTLVWKYFTWDFKSPHFFFSLCVFIWVCINY